MQKLNCCCKMTAESACFTALGLGEVVNCSKRTAFHLFVAAAGESRRAEGLQCRLGAGGAAWDPGCSVLSKPRATPCTYCRFPASLDGCSMDWREVFEAGLWCLGFLLFSFTVSC